MNGKVCYLEIPSADVTQSAVFYSVVFGWQSRMRGDGSLAFDDASGDVSGSWVVGTRPAQEPGVLVYLMVDSMAASVESIIANGGTLVQAPRPDSPVVTARFRDPAGNVFGLYQDG